MNKKHKIWQSHIPGHALGAAVVKNPRNPKDNGDVGFAIQKYNEKDGYGSGYDSRSFEETFKKVETDEISEWKI